ncbi:MAG: alpha/beta fold hydrolase [Spirochaetia bacterium]|nr:alpha/beta fold hydrolase [Spirochaetia bacterium]
MKKTAILCTLVLAAALTCISCASTGKSVSASDDALIIAKQGVFTSGGTVTEPVPGAYAPEKSWMDGTRAGNTAHVDHANTFYQIPAGEAKNPIVYLHGYGQSRTGWQSTPDGREGWSDIFLKKGYPAFLVDQPRRASAGNTSRMASIGGIDAWGEDGKEYMPGDQAWYTHFRIGLIAPERYEGSAFPAGDDAQNQFFRQMTPNTGDYDEKLFGSVLSDVLSDAYKMTGKKAIYITHSQGGRVGWQTDTENLAAIVAVEPGGTPAVDSPEYKKFLEAKIPMIIYFGDYIDNGPENIMSTGFWKKVRDTAIDFAEHYNADGGDATVVDLPKIGITGNSHFLFQEMNNKEIADHLEKWLNEREL